MVSLGVMMSAPLAVAAPLNMASTICLKVSTSAPSVTYSAVAKLVGFRKFSPPFKLTDIDLCTTITNVSVLFSVLTRLVCLCNIPPSCKQVR